VSVCVCERESAPFSAFFRVCELVDFVCLVCGICAGEGLFQMFETTYRTMTHHCRGVKEKHLPTHHHESAMRAAVSLVDGYKKCVGSEGRKVCVCVCVCVCFYFMFWFISKEIKVL